MPETAVHRTAEVSARAVIGEGVRIGPYAVIDDGAVIGDGTVIEAFARLTSYVRVGRNCHIFDGAILGQPPQDHDFGGETSYVMIGDDVVLREGVTIHRATGEGLATVVGRGSLLMEGCHLGHNVRVGEYCTLTNKVGLSGHVQMGDYVVAGGLAGFHQFVRVGSYAMVGGMAKIVMDVPPYSLVDGNPASMYGLNAVGLKRRGFSQAQRSRIKGIYKALFENAASLEDGLASIEERYAGDGFAREIAAFVANSKRGVYHWRPGVPEHRSGKK
jgi:UDP-N-acetylglucosamine acyltransferase